MYTHSSDVSLIGKTSLSQYALIHFNHSVTTEMCVILCATLD